MYIDGWPYGFGCSQTIRAAKENAHKAATFWPEGRGKLVLLGAIDTIRDLAGVADDIAGEVLDVAALSRLRALDCPGMRLRHQETGRTTQPPSIEQR